MPHKLPKCAVQRMPMAFYVRNSLKAEHALHHGSHRTEQARNNSLQISSDNNSCALTTPALLRISTKVEALDTVSHNITI